jgi:hypothetical protein
LRESQRVNGKPKIVSIIYLGPPQRLLDLSFGITSSDSVGRPPDRPDGSIRVRVGQGVPVDDESYRHARNRTVEV